MTAITATAKASLAKPSEKHYWPVTQVPGLFIGKCGQVLPNKAQCWRNGDFLVEDSLSTGKVIYQLCRTHVVLQKLYDKIDNEKIASGDIQVPPASDYPPPPTTLEALQQLETSMYDPNAPILPPIALSAEQLKSPQFASGGTVPIETPKQEKEKEPAKEPQVKAQGARKE